MAKVSAILSESPLWAPATALPAPAESPHPPLQVPALNSLICNGLPRGTVMEITGARSTGRTSSMLAILATATRAGEVCAVVDTTQSFSPESAEAAGVRLSRVLWVRCNQNADHALRATDLLLHAGGFGLICLDLCEVPVPVLNRIPLSYWHRFRRAVENTPAILLVCADSSQAKSSFVNHLELVSEGYCWHPTSSFSLLQGMRAKAKWQQSSLRQLQSLWMEA